MESHRTTEFSIIAQLVFAKSPLIDLTSLVSELDLVLQRIQCVERRLSWDHDDVAIFDMPGIRIILALITAPRKGVEKCLTVSVGPSPLRRIAALSVNHANLCARLVERLQARLSPDGVIWHDTSDMVQVDLIDAITAEPRLTGEKAAEGHPVYSNISELTIDDLLARCGGSLAQDGFTPNNDQPDLPVQHHDAELCRLREALYPALGPVSDAPQRSPQMRLAIYTMNATLVAVSLPIGIAVMSHSLIKGDNLRATTGALVATGFGMSFFNANSLQSLLALAG